MTRIIFIFLFLSINTIWAQSDDNIAPDNYMFIGQVIEASSKQPIDFATVTLRQKATDNIVAGVTTENGGLFRLSSTDKDVYLEISFLGFETKRIEEFTFLKNKADLGIIYLGSDVEVLEEIIVRADKSTTEFKLDKRVFNVGSDLSSSGAGALEVLNNVPSVNVDIEGSVTLRGSSGVQILINGKPSVLADDESSALGSITADIIEKIEVITNPSAKYEAEGTAGIINIVLKKNEKSGTNGSVSVNIGTRNNHSFGLSLNKRTEKFNLFTQLGVGLKARPTDTENINEDFLSDITLSSIGKEDREELYYNVILGTDYYINESNVITLSGSFSYEIEDQPSLTEFTLADGQGTILQNWNRSELTEADNPKFQYELQYKKDFPDHKDHDLLFSAIGNFFGKDQSSFFQETLLSSTGNVNNQTTATDFQEGKYTFNLDYTKPVNNNWTIETGAQYVDNKVSNDYTVSDEIDGVFVVDPGLTNLFEYDQKVLGAYGTTAYEGETWGIKLGLRAEHTDLSTLLTNTGEDNTQNFVNLFPSAHSSYKLNERISFQAGYSRRIYRPRLWDLNPFFNIRNTFSIRAGNPLLTPEYTDSYEIGSIFIYEGISFNINAFHRYTTDKIDRISKFENNVNIFAPENVGTSNTTGLEFNFKYSPLKKLTINGDGNYNYFVRSGTFNDQVFDFQNDQWSTKITTKLKVSKAIDVEVTGRYESGVQTVQGMTSENIYTDLGMRYKILNGKAVFNFSIRDIFATRIRESFTFGDDFSAYSFRQSGRFMTLGFSYGFGKGEAITYGGGGRRR